MKKKRMSGKVDQMIDLSLSPLFLHLPYYYSGSYLLLSYFYIINIHA